MLSPYTLGSIEIKRKCQQKCAPRINISLVEAKQKQHPECQPLFHLPADNSMLPQFYETHRATFAGGIQKSRRRREGETIIPFLLILIQSMKIIITHFGQFNFYNISISASISV